MSNIKETFEIVSIDSERNKVKSEEKKGLTVVEGALALISCVIGGGIVSIPYAMATLGPFMGIALNVICAVMGYWSGLLYLKAKLLAPVPVMTLYELAYLAFGKRSVFLVAFMAVSSNVGCVVLYLIVYGDLASSLSK